MSYYSTKFNSSATSGEVGAAVGNLDANDLSFSSSGTSLTASTVQGAIDEVNAKVDGVSLTDLQESYDNTVPPVIATTDTQGPMKFKYAGSLFEEKEQAIQLLLDLEPRIDEIADLTVHYIGNIDSTNMSPEIWDDIAKEIHRSYDDYDGFVITHGTDTMAV